MAWQRTIPFGYRMRDGKIEPNPAEADAVEFIYSCYRQGDSYLTIAGAMSELGVRYHAATPDWNKHMVKRILENPKYAGQGAYPAILTRDSWLDAQTVRNRKTLGWQEQSECVELLKRRMVCRECGAPFSKITPTNATGNRWWHCSNPECGCTLRIKDEPLEEAVTALMNRLIAGPELLDPREPGEYPLSLEAGRIQNEINRELGKPDMSEKCLTVLIFACAAEKYNILNGSEMRSETARLKAELREHPLLTAFDARLFIKTAEALLISADGTLSLRLTGGNILSENRKEQTNHADDH